MKVLHINTTTSGGAARAAFRIHEALLKNGVDSYIYVLEPGAEGNRIFHGRPAGILEKVVFELKFMWWRGWELIVKKLFNVNMKTPISLGIGSLLNRKIIEELQPDVINLHWICGNFISLADINWLSRYKLVWTLHDSWSFTGGCHIPYECKKWQTGCKSCHLLKKKFGLDLAKLIFKHKQNYIKKSDIKIVGVSKWITECAKTSFLFQDKEIFLVHNTLDQDCFNPKNKSVVRDMLGLPQGKRLILFGAMNSTSDENKGFKLLHAAIHYLLEQNLVDNIELMVFGSDEPQDPPDFGAKIYYMGRFVDDLSLSMLYSAADVMIVPSRSETLPNTALEAISSGIPVVAFRIGGLPDQIEHKVNGYLAEPFDCEDLAQGIAYVLEDDERWQKMSQSAREKAVSCFSEEKVAKGYMAIYEKNNGSKGR